MLNVRVEVQNKYLSSWKVGKSIQIAIKLAEETLLKLPKNERKATCYSLAQKISLKYFESTLLLGLLADNERKKRV